MQAKRLIAYLERIAGVVANGVLLGALLATPSALSQPAPDNQPDTEASSVANDAPASLPVHITVTGIMKVGDSFINVILLPINEHARERFGRSKVSYSECANEDSFCGSATVTVKNVLAGADYTLRVCHTRHAKRRSCPVGVDGKTTDAGTVMEVRIDNEDDASITLNLENLYP